MYSVPLCCHMLLLLFMGTEKDKRFVFTVGIWFVYSSYLFLCLWPLIWLMTKFMTYVIMLAFNDLYNSFYVPKNPQENAISEKKLGWVWDKWKHSEYDLSKILFSSVFNYGWHHGGCGGLRSSRRTSKTGWIICQMLCHPWHTVFRRDCFHRCWRRSCLTLHLGISQSWLALFGDCHPWSRFLQDEGCVCMEFHLDRSFITPNFLA